MTGSGPTVVAQDPPRPHASDGMSVRQAGETPPYDDSPPNNEQPADLTDPTYGMTVPDAHPHAQAVSLAGMLLRITRQPTWRALADAVEAGDTEVLIRLADYHLSDEQLALLDAHADLITLTVAEPVGTIAVCQECGSWLAIGRKGVPSSCRSTSGCTGKVVKAPRATKRRLPTDPGPTDRRC